MFQHLLKRFQNDINFKKLAFQVLIGKKLFICDIGDLHIQIYTFKKANQLIVTIPSFNIDYGHLKLRETPKSLNLEFSKAIIGIITGALAQTTIDPTIKSIRFVGQDIVNTRLIETLVNIGFTQQKNIDLTGFIVPYYRITGKFLEYTMNVY